MSILPNRGPNPSPWVLIESAGLLLVTVSVFLLRGGGTTALLSSPQAVALAGGFLALLAYLWHRHGNRTLPCHFELVHILPRLGASFGLVALGLALSGIAWSVVTFLLYMGLSLAWTAACALLEMYWAHPHLLLPHGCWEPLAKTSGNARLEMLEKPRQDIPKGSCIAANLESLPEYWNILLAEGDSHGTPVCDVLAAYEMLNGRICLAQPSRIPTAFFRPSPLYGYCKGLLDFSLSFLLLCVLLLPMAIIAIAIRLDSSGPILFAQERIGRMGHRFNMLKFRTMDAATSGGDFTHSTDSQDQRITRVGRLLRKFRLDELPQLFNVMRAEMSLIGPRPAVRTVHAEQSQLIPLYSHRLTVRPGITGWAQVRQGYVSDEDLEESQKKVEYDLYYIKHFSLWLDIAIFLMTLAVILGGRGAR